MLLLALFQLEIQSLNLLGEFNIFLKQLQTVFSKHYQFLLEHFYSIYVVLLFPHNSKTIFFYFINLHLHILSVLSISS